MHWYRVRDLNDGTKFVNLRFKSVNFTDLVLHKLNVFSFVLFKAFCSILILKQYFFIMCFIFFCSFIFVDDKLKINFVVKVLADNFVLFARFAIEFEE